MLMFDVKRPDLVGRGVFSYENQEIRLKPRIRWTSDAEGVEDETNQSVSGEHNEHAKEAPENFPLPLFPTSIHSLR